MTKKLTSKTALEIYNRRQLGQKLMAEAHTLSNAALADKFDLHKKSVGRVIAGDRWKTGSGKSKYKGMNYDLALLLRDAAKERDRLKLLAAEHSIKKLADEYGVCCTHVAMIGTGYRWGTVGMSL